MGKLENAIRIEHEHEYEHENRPRASYVAL